MNRYSMIYRLTGPAMLVLTGVLALLNQAHILSWGKSWPLYLILLGVLKLAQRAAFANFEADTYAAQAPGYGQPPSPPPPAPGTSMPVTTIVEPAPEPREWRP